jgi:phage tail-like protein
LIAAIGRVDKLSAMKHTDIQRLLPEVFRRTLQPGTPLSALLEVMELFHEPATEVIDRWDELLDPRRTDDDWVPFLARWLDLERFFESPQRGAESPLQQVPLSTGLGRLRELTAVAAQISQWRGTARGLRLILETVTGLPGEFTIDERVPGIDGRPLPFHINVQAPASVLPFKPLLERIIEQEKPAYVTFTLEFAAILPV